MRWRDSFHSIGIWYWRDQQGNEVDILLEVDQQIIAIECKLSEKPISRDIRGIEKLHTRNMYKFLYNQVN
ncbi:MAG: DUF4143 domain-containing protein [Gammaproteobacteria bacterium]|nr:DUF4143 domain-containing protein [Gammaproteobacteria bacterium]